MKNCGIDGCNKSVHGNGKYCQMHYIRFYRHGHFELTRPSVLDRFESKLKPMPNGCCYYNGYATYFGYGRLRYKGKKILAHRLSWILTYGEIPENLCVLHKCDNPECVNPKHLFLGTQKDNHDDAVKKGRINPSERAKHGWELRRQKEKRC